MALAAFLTGAPQALRSALEPEHRCQCPAGDHICSCPRCAAKASQAATRAAAASSPTAKASRARPPCHGGAVPALPAEEETSRSRPDAPCLSAGCQGIGAVASQPGGVDPFVVREHRAPIPRGRPERSAPSASLTAVDPSAPEPPPPRA